MDVRECVDCTLQCRLWEGRTCSRCTSTYFGKGSPSCSEVPSAVRVSRCGWGSWDDSPPSPTRSRWLNRAVFLHHWACFLPPAPFVCLLRALLSLIKFFCSLFPPLENDKGSYSFKWQTSSFALFPIFGPNSESVHEMKFSNLLWQNFPAGCKSGRLCFEEVFCLWKPVGN